MAEDIRGMLQIQIKKSLEELRTLLTLKIAPENKQKVNDQINKVIADLTNLAVRLPATLTAPVVMKADDAKTKDIHLTVRPLSPLRQNLDYGHK
jgi:hypothetical protein